MTKAEPVEKISILEVGKLINDGWELKKTLSHNISNDIINKAYEESISRGAYGGKLFGAGGGGFLAFISDPKNHPSFHKSVSILLYILVNIGAPHLNQQPLSPITT
mgnify:CR=1 FL=1